MHLPHIHIYSVYIPAIVSIFLVTCMHKQSGATAVLLACQHGYRELLELLIDRYHCSAKDKDKASLCTVHHPNTCICSIFELR